MSTYDLIEEINDKVWAHVQSNMKEVNAVRLGLDARAASRLYVDDQCIAVRKDSDRLLQYYGGFEYIDKEFRKEIGSLVFYFLDESSVDNDEETGEEYYSCRVGECLNRLKENDND